jgi:type I restriction enzyme S subunit
MPTPTVSSIDLNPHDLLEVLQVLDTYLPGVEVRAFGSRVRWTAKPYSDLDLALMTHQPLPLDQAAQLREALDETTLPFKVDVVDWSSTSETFRDIIQSNNVIIRPASTVATEHWAAMTLDEALEALLDYRGKTPEKTTSGIPLITAKIVKDGRIETPTEFIGIEDYDAWMTRGLPKAGDVVLTTEAPLGEVAQLDTSRVALAQRIVVLRGKSGLLDNTYLRYLLQTYEMQEQLASRATGTTVVGIKQSELRKISLRFPPISRQVAVANILATLDDKIELNRRMNKTLEAMARAIFQSWFVDFDPVRSKASGESADSTCQRLGLTPELLALFPNSFEDSELGEIPMGWTHSTLAAEAKRYGGLIQTGPFGSQLHASDYVDEGVPVVMPQDLNNRRISVDRIVRVTEEMAQRLTRHRVKPGDVVYSRRGDVERHALVSEREAGWLCGTGCLLVRLGAAWPSQAYLSEVLDLPVTREWLVRHAVGATMPNLNTSILGDVPLLMPSEPLLHAFEAIAGPFRAQQVASSVESDSLAHVREALLPKLLNGEIGLETLGLTVA